MAADDEPEPATVSDLIYLKLEDWIKMGFSLENKEISQTFEQ